MAVDGIARELRLGNEAEYAATGQGANRTTERRYRRRFLVKTTDSKDPASVALLAPGLPGLGTQYVSGPVFDPEARVVSLRPQRLHRRAWHVDVEYSTETDDGDDPLNREPRMSFNFQTFRVPIVGELDQDAAGDADKVFKGAMRTTAGEIFDPPPEMDESRPVLKIVRNESTFKPLTAMLFQDAVNEAPWGGAQARQVKVNRISTSGKESEKINGFTYEYYPVTYELHYKRETWDIRLLNAGWYYLNAAGADPTDPDNLVEFKDSSGKPRKGLLADDGTALADGEAVTYVRKRAYKELNFNLLNLPQTFV